MPLSRSQPPLLRYRPNRGLGESMAWPVMAWTGTLTPICGDCSVLIGYIRVSTNDQNTDLQRIALQSADCELIFEDRISGKTRVRPGLKKALRCLEAGQARAQHASSGHADGRTA